MGMSMGMPLVVLSLLLGGVYALIALGLNLVYGTTRLLNIAHGEFIMLGGYVAYWSHATYGISPLISVFTAGGLAAVAGALLYIGPFRYIARRYQSVEVLEIASLLLFFGLMIISQNGAAALWSANLRGYSYLSGTVDLFGVPTSMARLVAFGVAVAISFGLYALMTFTTLGKAVRAVVQDRTAAEIMGIRPDVIYALSVALGFGVTAAAGALISMFTEVSPFMGGPYTIIAFVIITLGGMGSFGGTLAAAFLIAFLETFGVYFTSPGLRPTITYLLFVAVILLRPTGFFGIRTKVR